MAEATTITRLDHVLDYLHRGWHPIPVHYSRNGMCSCHRGQLCPFKGKHPVPSGWQTTLFTEDELRKFWKDDPYWNVGIVTGPVSKIMVLDCDDGKGGPESLFELEEEYGPLPLTPTVDTGGGGAHYYFQYPDGIYIPNRGGFLPGLDVRGVGGQAVAPPSYHQSGNFYRWRATAHPGMCSPAPLPVWLRKLCEEQEPMWLGEKQPKTEAAEAYFRDNRNTNLFTLGRRLHVIEDLNPTLIHDMLHLINAQKCVPPLDSSEVDHIIRNVLRKGSSQTIVPVEAGGLPPPDVKTIDMSKVWGEGEDAFTLPYVLPSMLFEGEIGLLAAPTEAGKSMLAMSMAVSLAAGLPVIGRGSPCTPQRVMYCTEELAGRTIHNRIRRLGLGMGADQQLVKENLMVLPQQNLSLGLRDSSNLESFFFKADKFKPALVVLDTLISYRGAANPQEGGEDTQNRLWYHLVPIALRAKYGCAVIVQHHARKKQLEGGKRIQYKNMDDIELMENIRGTSDIVGVSERVWFMWKVSEERTDFGPLVRIMLRNTKAREGDKHDPILLTMRDLDENRTVIIGTIGVKSKRQREVEEIIKLLLKPGEEVASDELTDWMGKKGVASRSAQYDWIKRLRDDGFLILDKNGKYRLNPNDELP